MRRSILHWTAVALGVMTLAAVLPAAQTNTTRSAPPMPSAVGGAKSGRGHLSPVQYFRSLLGMTTAEREKALARRTPESRQAILAKVHEYEAMPRAVREARLCQTELHWELSGLMRLAPAERKARLGEVSPLYRPMVEGLLQQWDALPVNTRKDLLEKQDFISLYLRMEGAGAQKDLIDRLSPERRARWTEDLARWQALPERERTELCAQFQRFCAMTGAEQKETTGPLTEAERKAMELAMERFNRLPPAQRAQCINSFDKFAALPADERAQFVNNAGRWEIMTAYERQLWRQLVRQLPPMPPLPKELPPLPNRARHTLPPLPSNVTAPVVIALSTNALQ